jgi:hypothetical protein
MKLLKVPLALLVLVVLSCSGVAYDLSVSAGAQNQGVSESRSYTMAQGTRTVTLLYNVESDELPFFVSINSIYNDVWSLAVTASTGSLFDIVRQINTQLTKEPTWRDDATTGDIRRVGTPSK